MSNIVPFIFENHQVRVLADANGDTLFVAKDVAVALGYKDPATAVKSHCKGVQELHPLQTPGGIQEVRVIREPDMYRLIFGSTRPSAQDFEKVVVGEILPTIRKTGSYSTAITPGQHPAHLRDPRVLAPLLLKADLEVSALLGIPLHLAQVEAVKVVMNETGIDYLPRLALAPAQSNIPEDDLMLEPADLAKHLGIKSGEDVNRWLARMGLQEKSGSSWVPTAKAEGKCAPHQWRTQYKSGYNLKWSVAFTKSLLPEDWKITKDA